MLSDCNDPWDVVAERLVRRAADEARKQRSATSLDIWDHWSIQVLKGSYGRNEFYFPSSGGGLVFGSLGEFSHETREDAAWRHASTRMKRQADLWKSHNDSYADPWGRWCTARGSAPSRSVPPQTREA